MRSVTHFLRYSSLKCSKQTFTVRSAIVNSFSRLSSPQRRSRKLKKKFSLLWKISLPSNRIQELKNSQAQRNKTDQTIHEARLFKGSIVKTKHRGLTSLTFTELVPGADRMVRHICIRCILMPSTDYFGETALKQRHHIPVNTMRKSHNHTLSLH